MILHNGEGARTGTATWGRSVSASDSGSAAEPSPCSGAKGMVSAPVRIASHLGVAWAQVSSDEGTTWEPADLSEPLASLVGSLRSVEHTFA